MPVLAFFAVVGSVLFAFAVVGSVLVALLFAADATLENSSPVIVTSQRTGLPVPRYHNVLKTLATAPAPAPDMTSVGYVDCFFGCSHASERIMWVLTQHMRLSDGMPSRIAKRR
jgi:hypothetical protein